MGGGLPHLGVTTDRVIGTEAEYDQPVPNGIPEYWDGRSPLATTRIDDNDENVSRCTLHNWLLFATSNILDPPSTN